MILGSLHSKNQATDFRMNPLNRIPIPRKTLPNRKRNRKRRKNLNLMSMMAMTKETVTEAKPAIPRISPKMMVKTKNRIPGPMLSKMKKRIQMAATAETGNRQMKIRTAILTWKMLISRTLMKLCPMISMPMSWITIRYLLIQKMLTWLIRNLIPLTCRSRNLIRLWTARMWSWRTPTFAAMMDCPMIMILKPIPISKRKWNPCLRRSVILPMFRMHRNLRI